MVIRIVNLQSSIPEKNATLFHDLKHEHYRHNYGENYGFGQVVDEKNGLYNTNYFQFYHMIMSKLRVHPRRTMKREEAEFYIMPYDIGFAAQWNKTNGKYQVHQTGGCHEYQEINQLLENELSQTTLHGHNILILNSIFDFFCQECYSIFSKCANCTHVGPELHDSSGNSLYHPKHLKLPDTINRRVYSLPYPSAYHWNDNLITPPWNIKPAPYVRDILVTYWAALYVQLSTARKLRSILNQQCLSNLKYCYKIDVQSRLPNKCVRSTQTNCLSESSFYLEPTPHSSDNPAPPHLTGFEAYERSIFCLEPAGDSEGRKGIFDSLLVGCIPVIFGERLLSKLYPWYFTTEIEEDVTIFIPYQAVSIHRVNVIDILRNISSDVIKKKQKAIQLLGNSIQYSVPPAALRDFIGFGGATGKLDGKRTWSPPFRDAVDILLDSMSGIVTRYTQSGRIPPDEIRNTVSRWDYYWTSNTSPRKPAEIR